MNRHFGNRIYLLGMWDWFYSWLFSPHMFDSFLTCDMMLVMLFWIWSSAFLAVIKTSLILSWNYDIVKKNFDPNFIRQSWLCLLSPYVYQTCSKVLSFLHVYLLSIHLVFKRLGLRVPFKSIRAMLRPVYEVRFSFEMYKAIFYIFVFNLIFDTELFTYLMSILYPYISVFCQNQIYM